MGSLTSRPKVPQVQQQPVIITMPSAPVYETAVVPVTTSPSSASSTAPSVSQNTATANTVSDAADVTDTGISEEAKQLAREDSLLRRSRGRVGTILTGFSGLLSQAASSSGRKTLLGE